MKNRLVKLFSLITMAVILSAAETSFSEEKRTQSFDMSPGRKVVIELKDGGSIRITGWDKSSAKVTYYDRTQGLGPYNIDITSRDREGLNIVAFLEDDVRSTNLHFDIYVPEKTDLEFFTNGGGLQLENVEGIFKGKTKGGGISLDRVKGDVKIKTMGGAINVVDSEVDGEIHTMGGSVLVKDVVGDLRATSNGGEVRYLNVRKKSGGIRGPGRDGDEEGVTAETVQISSMGGSIDVDEAPDGAIVSTAGGGIDVRAADRFVKARTGGGDISIEIVRGWVNARTGAGDIDVVIEKNGSDDAGVTLITGIGDVSVTVPPGFSMELDVDLAYTRNSDRDYRIHCDFDFDEERTQEWDYSSGTPRKHIYGTGKIAGGRHTIKITTVNGDVYIKQGN